MRINNFPYRSAKLLEQLTEQELDRYFLVPIHTLTGNWTYRLPFYGLLSDIYRQHSRNGEIDAALKARLLSTLKDYISILD